MAAHEEKVYVVVGKDTNRGSTVIRWSLCNWSKQPAVSFVILQVSVKSKDLVYTPIGILPVSSVNTEMLEVLRAREQESADKISRKYMGLCSKVKAEIMRIERFDEPLEKIIVGLISELEIKKLVMDVTMTKSLAWKNKCDIKVAYSVHKLKPLHCELFVLCKEKLLFFKVDNNGGEYVEDENGVMIADIRKEKGGPKGLLDKIFTYDASANTNSGSSTPLVSSNSKSLKDQYEEVENYISYLQTMCKQGAEEDEDTTLTSQCQSEDTGIEMEKLNSSPSSKEVLETKIKEAQRMVEEKHREAKAEAERRSKAEWGISICNQMAGEIEAQLNEEITKQRQMKEELEKVRRQASELYLDIMESTRNLKAEHEHENELKIRLNEFTMEKSEIEEQLGNAMKMKAEMERKMETVRRKRDALRRKIEFCRERQLVRSWQQNCTEFTADEISQATGGFSEDMKIGVGENSVIYRAKLFHFDVAIKFSTEFSTMKSEEFKAQVDLLNRIRHPNILHVIGSCEERRCVVFEFAPHGSVREALFSAAPQLLPWHARIRVAAEVASALGFLHAAGLGHGRLRASRVLLDRHLSAKLAGLRPFSSSPSATDDTAALGEFVLQLLTRREEVSAEEVQRARGWGGGGDLAGLVDRAAGDWPMDHAAELAEIGLELCCAAGAGDGGNWTAEIGRELEDLKERVMEMRKKRGCEGDQNEELPVSEAPTAFFCPILQEMMKQPHVAADGFSYELEAIKEWFDSGHDTSPMTNLRLKHTHLTPNHTLRSLINNWYDKIQPS
ncbi:U-box domain-containing protein 50 isoform X1 [Canna indica]|uniref:RING-type E3 ubiquitin transferase n=1 Tax=Canna indica TaxID=4628 RepID=A0AAQ3QDX1_9LILI|nr:U-box domain-containing protein 50 isoform X1 [Canna indica]